MKTAWILRGRPPKDGRTYQDIAAEFGISPVTVRCMCNRGVTDAEAMGRFLSPSLDKLYDPMLMKGMKEAVELILSLKNNPGLCAIATDYDCDGIFSAHVLKLGLERLGFKTVTYTPDRVKEGYGLNRRIVDDAVKTGAGWLITCDNGIAAVDAVAYAKECGLTVIVTDHHEPQAVLPAADVILDPKQEGETYPFSGLCGAGVAYKLICALLCAAGDAGLGTGAETADEGVRGEGCAVGEQLDPARAGAATSGEDLLHEMLQYVAIATVADVMELIDENRILVKHGLEVLERTSNCGLRATLRCQKIENRKLKASDIGFIIGPCFNASGRISTTQDASRVLLAQSEEEAETAAEKLCSLNDERKRMTEECVDEGIRMLLEKYPGLGGVQGEVLRPTGGVSSENEISESDKTPDVLMLYMPGVHESIVGLVAGKIKERFNHPTIVFTDTHPVEELIKGSGRSIPAYNMFDALNSHIDLMVRFGGHAMAAGLTIRKKDFEKLSDMLNMESGLSPDDFVQEQLIDVPMPVSYVTEQLVGELESLAPFGNGNPRPVFAEKGFKIRGIRTMGAENQHIKLQLESSDGTRVDGLAFSRAGEFFAYMREKVGTDTDGRQGVGYTLALAYQPEINEFRGNRQVQLKLIDWVVEERRQA